jgi:hypothetical protein
VEVQAEEAHGEAAAEAAAEEDGDRDEHGAGKEWVPWARSSAWIHAGLFRARKDASGETAGGEFVGRVWSHSVCVDFADGRPGRITEGRQPDDGIIWHASFH